MIFKNLLELIEKQKKNILVDLKYIIKYLIFNFFIIYYIYIYMNNIINYIFTSCLVIIILICIFSNNQENFNILNGTSNYPFEMTKTKNDYDNFPEPISNKNFFDINTDKYSNAKLNKLNKDKMKINNNFTPYDKDFESKSIINNSSKPYETETNSIKNNNKPIEKKKSKNI